MSTADFHKKDGRAFTLIELLVVIAIVALLAALLMPALSNAKQQGYKARCQGHLHQVGIALHMFVADDSRFPTLLSGNVNDLNTWPQGLAPYLFGREDSNQVLSCPGFKGTVNPWGSRLYASEGPGYSYNCIGAGRYAPFMELGLNEFVSLGEMGFSRGITEANLRTPSEMFAISDSLFVRWGTGQSGQSGLRTHKTSGLLDTFPFLNRTRASYNWEGIGFSEGAGLFVIQQPPQHGKQFNMLFTDGHVSSVLISNLFDVRKSARNWNRDNEPHPENW